jgi:hypothetical protein
MLLLVSRGMNYPRKDLADERPAEHRRQPWLVRMVEFRRTRGHCQTAHLHCLDDNVILILELCQVDTLPALEERQ